jgi:hypothetical protein
MMLMKTEQEPHLWLLPIISLSLEAVQETLNDRLSMLIMFDMTAGRAGALLILQLVLCNYDVHFLSSAF